MDRKSLIAIVLCGVFYIGYEFYLNQKYPDRFKKHKNQTELVESSVANTTLANTDTALTPDAKEIAQLSDSELTVNTEDVRFHFSQKTGGFDSLVLNSYKSEDLSRPMDIAESPVTIVAYSQNPSLNILQREPVFEATRDGEALIFARSEGPWRISHSIQPDPSGYGSQLKVTWTNTSAKALDLDAALVFAQHIPFQKKSSGFFPGMPSGRPTLLLGQAGKGEWHDVQDFCSDAKKSIHGLNQNIDFIGFDNHYFMKLLIPQSNNLSYNVVKVPEGESCRVYQVVHQEQGLVQPGASIELAFKDWFGPKQTKLMEGYDERLQNAVDYGFFGVISRPLLAALGFIHSLVGNWGLAIIIFTILLKFLFYPLTKQAALAQNRMKKLQPEMNRIKEKFKDDPRRQQQEIMLFMQSKKVNPMKGCLPILPQFPVFIAFYRVLSTSIELRHAPFFGWITDLSTADPYYITPLVLGGAMLLQQRLMPTTGLDKAQERIMMLLPLFFTAMMLTLPAGMVIYMLTNTLVSIAQQQWLNHRLAEK